LHRDAKAIARGLKNHANVTYRDRAIRRYKLMRLGNKNNKLVCFFCKICFEDAAQGSKLQVPGNVEDSSGDSCLMALLCVFEHGFERWGSWSAAERKRRCDLTALAEDDSWQVACLECSALKTCRERRLKNGDEGVFAKLHDEACLELSPESKCAICSDEYTPGLMQLCHVDGNGWQVRGLISLDGTAPTEFFLDVADYKAIKNGTSPWRWAVCCASRHKGLDVLEKHFGGRAWELIAFLKGKKNLEAEGKRLAEAAAKLRGNLQQ